MRGIRIQHRPGRPKPHILITEIDGERKERGFVQLADAVAEKMRLESERLRHGVAAVEWDAAAHREWKEARRLIGDDSVPLARVVEFWLNHAKRECPSIPVLEAVEQFITEKETQELSDMHMADLRNKTRRFGRDMKRFTVEKITAEDCMRWANGLGISARGIRNYWTTAGNFLNWCARRGWTDKAPKLHESDLPKVKASKKGILTPAEAKTLFAYLFEQRPHFAAWFALQAFAGIRREESGRMEWEFFDFDEQRIVIPANVCKTGDDWVMEQLPLNLWSCLARVRDLPIRAPNHKSRDIILNAVGLAGKWPQNALRHSFCTYHLSLSRSADKTAMLLRHRNTSQLWRSYFAGLKPKADAEAYFAIVPGDKKAASK